MAPDADLTPRLRSEAERLEVDDVPTAAIRRRARRRRARTAGGRIGLALALVASAGGAWMYLRAEPPNYAHMVSPETLGVEPGSDPFGSTSGGGGDGGGGGGGKNFEAQSSGSVAEGSTASSGGSVGPGPGTGGRQQGGSTVVATAPRVIKTAELDLRVTDGTFSETFGRTEQIAARHGGFVTGSSTYTNPARSGDLTIRVPSERFELALADLRALGVVTSQRVEGQDVTAEFVDLEARLRNWEAHERVLLNLNEEATSIGESLQIQRELQSVQLEIERLRGQLQVLADQTALGTITVAVREAAIAEQEQEAPRGTWGRAVAAAGKVLAAMIVGLGYVAPVLAALALVWLGVRLFRRRRDA